MVVRTNDPMDFNVKSQKSLKISFSKWAVWPGSYDLVSVDNKSPAVCIFISPLDDF